MWRWGQPVPGPAILHAPVGPMRAPSPARYRAASPVRYVRTVVGDARPPVVRSRSNLAACARCASPAPRDSPRFALLQEKIQSLEREQQKTNALMEQLIGAHTARRSCSRSPPRRHVVARSAAFHDTFEEPRPPPAPSAERWAGPLLQQQVPVPASALALPELSTVRSLSPKRYFEGQLSTVRSLSPKRYFERPELSTVRSLSPKRYFERPSPIEVLSPGRSRISRPLYGDSDAPLSLVLGQSPGVRDTSAALSLLGASPVNPPSPLLAPREPAKPDAVAEPLAGKFERLLRAASELSGPGVRDYAKSRKQVGDEAAGPVLEPAALSRSPLGPTAQCEQSPVASTPATVWKPQEKPTPKSAPSGGDAPPLALGHKGTISNAEWSALQSKLLQRSDQYAVPSGDSRVERGLRF